MKERILALALVLALGLTLCGCSGTEPEAATPTPTPEAVETPAETPETVQTPAPTPPEGPQPELSLVMTPLAELRDDEGILVFAGFYTEPQFNMPGREAAAEKISESLAERLSTGGDEADELYEAACEHYESLDDGGKALWVSYQLSRQVEVKRGDGAILSVLGEGYSYGGGAHGMEQYFGMVYSTVTGEELGLEELFPNVTGLESTVRASVLAQAEQMEDSHEFFGLEDFVGNALENGSWYLSDEGLELIAASGEAAIYARGSVTFTVSYSELEGLIDPAYLPVGQEDGAAAEASPEDFELGFEAASEPMAEVRLDREADTFYLTAKSDTGPFTLCAVSWGGRFYVAVGDPPADESYVPGRGYIWVDGLKAGESLAVTGYFNDTPNFGLSFEDGRLFILAQSGKDGSLLIYEEA